MTRAVTLGQLSAMVQSLVPDIADRYEPAQVAQALKSAYADCIPLGVETEIRQVVNSDTLTINEFVVGRLIRCRIVGVGRGVLQPQEVAVPALRLSMNSTGQTLVRFPYPLVGATVELSGWMQGAWPTSNDATVPFPWPELISLYAAAQLYGMRLDHGATADITQFSELAQGWRMQADQMKMDIMGGLGLLPPPEEKKSSRGKKK